MSELAEKIIVVIRKRPLGRKEIQRKEEDIVDVQGDQSVIVKEVKQKVDLTKYVEEHMFNFDLAFDHNSSNEQLYINAVRPIIEAAFNRARVTCFAYGQTGSGKTYTMLGDPERQVPGMYLLASHDIFTMLLQQEFSALAVHVSFFEIYCGKLFDLLAQRQQIQIREDAKGNVNLINLQEKKVNSVQQLMQIIVQGQNVRVTSQNSANSESSRSHAILQINLKQGKSVFGKMSFIDLAGSERGADVQDQNKQTRIDGAEINKSLLALKECIRALDLNKNHTPFRGSKLTLVLKDSLTGNCRTVMIGNISPSNQSSEHTLNTLRYADRVKELKKPQDKQFQGDYIQRELMLARQNNNVVRKAYKNKDDDEDDSMSLCNDSSLQMGLPNKHSFSNQQQHLLTQNGSNIYGQPQMIQPQNQNQAYFNYQAQNMMNSGIQNSQQTYQQQNSISQQQQQMMYQNNMNPQQSSNYSQHQAQYQMQNQQQNYQNQQHQQQYQQQQQQQQQYQQQQQQQQQQQLQQQQSYQQQQQNQPLQQSKGQSSTANLLGRFNLQGFPIINGGNQIQNQSVSTSQQGSLFDLNRNQSSLVSSINYNQGNNNKLGQSNAWNKEQPLFQNYQQPALFPAQGYAQTQDFSNVHFGSQKEQQFNPLNLSTPQSSQNLNEQMMEEDLCSNNASNLRNDSTYYSLTGRYSQESQQSTRINSSKPLQELNINYDHNQKQTLPQKMFDYNAQQMMLNEHKHTIDRIVEITKDEMRLIQQYQTSNDFYEYVTRVIPQLQNKMDFLVNLQHKMKSALKECENRQNNFVPNTHTLQLFQQDDMLLSDEQII